MSPSLIAAGMPQDCVLTEADAAVVNAAADGIRKAIRTHVVEIGKHLISAKAVLPHGAFQAWVQAEFDISPRTATRYMGAASFLEAKSDTLADLPPAMIYTLASPTADPTMVAEVVDAAADGKSLAEVREQFSRSRDIAIEVAAQRHRAPKMSEEAARKKVAKHQEQMRQETEARKLAWEEEQARATVVVEQLIKRMKATASTDFLLLVDIMTSDTAHKVLLSAVYAEKHARSRMPGADR